MKLINVLLLALWWNYGESYKILAIFPMPFHSHYTLASKLLKELVSRGHEITVINPYPQNVPLANYTDISIKDAIDVLNERKQHLYDLDKSTIFGSVQFLTGMGYILSETTLKHPNVQKLLQSNEKFDLVIVAQFVNEALMGIAHHFQAPVVLMSTMPLFAWANFLLTQPTPFSYVPHSLTTYTGHMTFAQRFTNTFHSICSILYHQWVILPQHRDLVKKYIPGQPDLYEFLTNYSFILIHSHFSIYDAIPRPPNAIEIAGIHVDVPGNIPEDLGKFLDDSPEGVVIFSMGSNLKSADLPDAKRNAILRAFSKLRQKVLWKWETDELPGLPSNVKLMKWLPQSDVLAHPNVKIFISHGGLLSTIESVYHGVPIVGIPVFADQKMNIAAAVSYGYALEVSLRDLTEETLTAALDEILTNPRYKENVQKRSKLMKDRPISPVNHAIYWIEYVIRHQGAPHLRYPGMDLTWWQRNLIDVLVSFILLISASFFILCRLLKKCRQQHTNKVKQN